MSARPRSSDEDVCFDSDNDSDSDASSCHSEASWDSGCDPIRSSTEATLPPLCPPHLDPSRNPQRGITPPRHTPQRTPLRAVANEDAHHGSMQRLRRTVATRVAALDGGKASPAASHYQTPAVGSPKTSSLPNTDELHRNLLRLSLQSLPETEGGAEDWLTGPAPARPSIELLADREAGQHVATARQRATGDAAVDRVAHLERQVTDLVRQQSDWERNFVEDVENEVERRLMLKR